MLQFWQVTDGTNTFSQMELTNPFFHVNFPILAFCIHYLLPWCDAIRKLIFFLKMLKLRKCQKEKEHESLTQSHHLHDTCLVFLPAGEQTRLNRSCASSICKNGGVCSLDVGAGTHFCQCTVNYQGKLCETREFIVITLKWGRERAL